ncbi:MAG: response regulator [Chloroflexota bacterium]
MQDGAGIGDPTGGVIANRLSGRPGEILIVEDDQDLLTLFRVVLEDAGWSVCTAADARQALAQVQASTPALVLMDLLLPTFPGEMLGRELRALFGDHVPILLTSASPPWPEVLAAVRPYDVLEKPFDLAALVEKVSRGMALSGCGGDEPGATRCLSPARSPLEDAGRRVDQAMDGNRPDRSNSRGAA